MCGRYSLALRPSQVREYLEAEGMQIDEGVEDEGDDAPRQSYNFAPGYYGFVYRADVPDWGAGPRHHDNDEDGIQYEAVEEISAKETKYKLQSMKWGLIPFWTKRNPDYASLLKTINCREDSLVENRGMWKTMKQRKRCVIIAQGFYEWLKKSGGKEKIPHYIKRKDGKLMCMAGLWDCVQYEGSNEKIYSYAIITTSSNKQLSFLHDRMPAILEYGTDDIQKWLDPTRYTWSRELQSLLNPYSGELEIYPVSKAVGKVGNSSPTFIVPVSSSENKHNIANFFNSKGAITKTETFESLKDEDQNESGLASTEIERESSEYRKTIDHTSTENEVLSAPETEGKHFKRKYQDDSNEPAKKMASPTKAKPASPAKPTKKMSATISSTSPARKTTGGKGSQKITNFFKK